jgi:hypothetical protein
VIGGVLTAIATASRPGTWGAVTRACARATNWLSVVTDTWTLRELPVLRYLVERFDDTATRKVELSEIESALGMIPEDVRSSVRALAGASPPYMEQHRGPRGVARAWRVLVRVVFGTGGSVALLYRLL